MVKNCSSLPPVMALSAMLASCAITPPASDTEPPLVTVTVTDIEGTRYRSLNSATGQFDRFHNCPDGMIARFDGNYLLLPPDIRRFTVDVTAADGGGVMLTEVSSIGANGVTWTPSGRNVEFEADRLPGGDQLLRVTAAYSPAEALNIREMSIDYFDSRETLSEFIIEARGQDYASNDKTALLRIGNNVSAYCCEPRVDQQTLRPRNCQ